MRTLRAWFTGALSGSPKKGATPATPATVEELEKRLAEGQADLEAAEAAVTDAREQLRRDRTDAALAAVAAAKGAADELREQLSLVEADVSDARAKRDAEERARLRQRFDELDAQLKDGAIVASFSDLRQSRADALMTLAETDLAEEKRVAEFQRLAGEHLRIAAQLGNENARLVSVREAVATNYYMKKELDSRIGSLSSSDPRRAPLRELRDALYETRPRTVWLTA